MPSIKKFELPIATLQRNCLGCGIEFTINGSKYDHRQTYCSLQCRQKAKLFRLGMNTKPRTFGAELNKVSIGAVAELMVCTDLLANGLSVFRSVSAASKFDIVASTINGDKLWKVEVKRGVKTSNEKFITFGRGIYDKEQKEAADIFALVCLEDAEVYYFNKGQAIYKLEHDVKFWELEIPHHELEKQDMVEKGLIEDE